MTDPIFYTVTNSRYFCGTVAALSSIRTYYPDNAIWVFSETREALNEIQIGHLRSLNAVHYVSAKDLSVGRVREAWQLKAHAAHFLAQTNEGVLVQVDSDAVFCSKFDDMCQQARESGVPVGGKDGSGVSYGEEYEPYRLLCKCAFSQRVDFNAHYTSTSILFMPIAALRDILELWSCAVDEAEWGPGEGALKLYAGYSDQGVLNAILYFKDIIPLTQPNELLSEHWTHGRSQIALRDGEFWNGNRRQRAFHSVGHAPKFWNESYLSYMEKTQTLEEVYLYWLCQLFDGPCGLWRHKSLASIQREQAALLASIDHDLVAQYLRRRKPNAFSSNLKGVG